MWKVCETKSIDIAKNITIINPCRRLYLHIFLWDRLVKVWRVKISKIFWQRCLECTSMAPAQMWKMSNTFKALKMRLKSFLYIFVIKWAMFFYDAKKQTDGQKCLLKKFIKIYLKQQRLV